MSEFWRVCRHNRRVGLVVIPSNVLGPRKARRSCDSTGIGSNDRHDFGQVLAELRTHAPTPIRGRTGSAQPGHDRRARRWPGPNGVARQVGTGMPKSGLWTMAKGRELRAWPRRCRDSCPRTTYPGSANVATPASPSRPRRARSDPRPLERPVECLHGFMVPSEYPARSRPESHRQSRGPAVRNSLG